MSLYKEAYSLGKIESFFSMRMHLKKISFCIFLWALLFPVQSLADEKQLPTNSQLFESCKTLKVNLVDANSSMCTLYIQAFLAGAWGVNNVKATKLIKQGDPLTWEQRAYRNRVGKRADRAFSSPITYYCSPDDDSELRIIEKLSDGLVSNIKTIGALNTQIYEAVKAICPSDES